MQSTAYSVCPLSISNFAGKVGVLLTGVTVIGGSDVLYVHCVYLATVMTSNTGQLFLLAGLAGKAYLYR